MTHPQPRTIAITGAGTGIGAACARRFAARGKSEAEGVTLTAAEVEQLDRLLDKGLDAVN